MSLRARIAAATLLGILLIPLTTSSLRGLTHVLTCSDEIQATLSVDTTAIDDTVLLDADSVTRGDDTDPGLCGGLVVTMELASSTTERADVLVSVRNDTTVDWRGSIELRLDGTPIPISIGRITAGETETDTIELRVRPGRTYDIEGTLLIGP